MQRERFACVCVRVRACLLTIIIAVCFVSAARSESMFVSTLHTVRHVSCSLVFLTSPPNNTESAQKKLLTVRV